MKWYKKPYLVAKIILATLNIFVTLLFFFVGMAFTQGHVDDSLFIMIVAELLFLVLSLVVYYLFVIASAVSKIADDSIKHCDD